MDTGGQDCTNTSFRGAALVKWSLGAVQNTMLWGAILFTVPGVSLNVKIFCYYAAAGYWFSLPCLILFSCAPLSS